MNKSIVLLSILPLLFFTSCEDFFQTEIEVELPEHERRLAYSGFAFNLNDSLHITHVVSTSRQLLDTKPNDTIRNSTFRFKTESSVLAEMSLTDFERSFIPISQSLFAGNEYSIEISAEGWESIRAYQVLPSAVEMESVTYEKEAGFNELAELGDVYTIRFDDNIDEDNYYLITGEKFYYYDPDFWDEDTTKVMRYEELLLSSLDPRVTNLKNYTGVVFSDQDMLENSYTLPLISDLLWFGGVHLGTLKIRLHSITKEAYDYLISRERFFENKDNPFSEPVIVNQNIENGYGMFILSNATEKIVPY